MATIENIQPRVAAMTLLIPMAGLGSRFSAAGYTDPKPLIPFLGKRMIQHVVDAFPYEARKIFIVLKEHVDQYAVDEFLKWEYPDCEVIVLDEITEGAACTVLKAKHLINNDGFLAIMNSDNIIHFRDDFLSHCGTIPEDGLIWVFEDSDPKWSFAKLNDDGNVVEVAEKKPISKYATAGLYFWREGRFFVEAAEQMIAKNIRVNNEFYVAPVYNENIKLGHTIRIKHVEAMHGVGTPEDLEAYIEAHSAQR